MEQLRHDRRDAVEVAGPRAAAQFRADLSDGDRYSAVVRIHLRNSRVKDHVDVLARAQLEVAPEITRVGGKIFGRTELQRVHEDTENDDVVLGARAPHQAGMALVEKAHRGNEA